MGTPHEFSTQNLATDPSDYQHYLLYLQMGPAWGRAPRASARTPSVGPQSGFTTGSQPGVHTGSHCGLPTIDHRSHWCTIRSSHSAHLHGWLSQFWEYQLQHITVHSCFSQSTRSLRTEGTFTPERLESIVSSTHPVQCGVNGTNVMQAELHGAFRKPGVSAHGVDRAAPLKVPQSTGCPFKCTSHFSRLPRLMKSCCRPWVLEGPPNPSRISKRH